MRKNRQTKTKKDRQKNINPIRAGGAESARTFFKRSFLREKRGLEVHNQIISSDQLKTQDYLDQIETWTEKKKMVLNEKKTKSMIFNYSKKYQFATDLRLKSESLNVVDEAKLLGLILTSDLKWNSNTQ